MNPGTQMGPYRVESLIGSGGMGDVYLATDTRLERHVAIKFVSQRLLADPALRERFDREAKVISSLNHPNICSLFDLGDHEGSSYLVMEYLQGESLADRIARGPLPPQQVIRIGTEIANALAAAHRQGIIHRDLKPGNVMLTKSGVKLLDFGLAKLSAASSPPAAMTSLATEQRPLTEQGAILGTFQYMSPEALEGHEADARSDIFALGAILYEMATAKRAFSGTSRASLIASILDREPPPMSEVQPMTPPSLERIVRACLAKDPDERIQTAHDVALELKWISESSSVAEAPGVRRRKKFAPWAAAASFAVVAAVLGVFYALERAKPDPPFTLSVTPPRDHVTMLFAISPDGQSVAFCAFHPAAGEGSLWVKRLDDGTSRMLAAKIERDWPFWSPDGKWVGFQDSSGRIMRIGIDGGQPEPVCRSSLSGRAAWSADGTLVFASRWGAGLSRVSAGGGEPAVLTKLDASRQESYHGNPQFLPDGKRFFFIIHTIAEKRNEIWAGSLDGARPVRVMDADALVGYSKPHLLFIRDGAIYAQRFDTAKLRPTGEPVRVIDNTTFWETEADGAVSLSQTGALVHRPFVPTRATINVYDRSGRVLRTLWEAADVGDPALTPDEKTLVVHKLDPVKGARDIVAVDLDRRIETRLTAGLASHQGPVISPDGQGVVYLSDKGGMFDIYRRSIDGTSPEELLWKDGSDKFPADWSPDGKYLIVSRDDAATENDLWLLAPGSNEKPQPLLVTERDDENARFSPDGRWIAYISHQSGEPELYVRPFPQGRAIRVSTDGGGPPAWSGDGRELVWVTAGNRVMAATIVTTRAVAEVGIPRQLFTLPRIWSAPIVMKDGSIALLVPSSGSTPDPPLEFTNAWRRKLARSGE